MKRSVLIFVFLLFASALFAQEELITTKQFMLGCKNVGSTEEVTHYISTNGEVWHLNSNFVFVTGGIYNSSLVTEGNADFSCCTPDWPGFNFTWKGGDPDWSLGLYKVTNSKQTDDYFYLDSRDSDFGAYVYPADFWIYFDNFEFGTYYHYASGAPISQGEIVGVWDIHGASRNISGLQNYWNNVLVILTDQNNPRLVWGPHPTFQATHFKVYRAVSFTPLRKPELSASLIATVSSSTYEYTDGDISLNGNNYVYYFVKGYNGSYSARTNIEEVRGIFYKEGIGETNDQQYSFTLSQNYPNPFNPSTTISYSVARNSLVSLKVYDILGIEIARLVNETKEPGNYSVSFDASKLSSSIYFYTLQTNDFIKTNKMMLIR